MLQSCCDLKHGLFGIESRGKLLMPLRTVNDVCQGSRTKLQGDIQEHVSLFLIVIWQMTRGLAGITHDAHKTHI